MRRSHLLAAGIAGIAAGSAGASVLMPTVGEPPTAPADTCASVSLVGSSGHWGAVLFWLGHDAAGPRTPVLNNIWGSPGDTVALGHFERGEPLLFALDVLTGSPDTIDMTDPLDAPFFAWWDLGGGVYRVGFEDPRLGERGEFSDFVFDIEFCTVPAPGAAGVIAAAGLAAVRRRRRPA